MLVAERHTMKTHLVSFRGYGDLSLDLKILELYIVLFFQKVVLRVDLGITLALKNTLAQDLDLKGFLVGVLPHDTLELKSIGLEIH